jgi:hypothetical protein
MKKDKQLFGTLFKNNANHQFTVNHNFFIIWLEIFEIKGIYE